MVSVAYYLSASVRRLARLAKPLTILALFAGLGLAACGTPSGPARPAPGPVVVAPERPADPGRWRERPDFIQPTHMEDRRPVRLGLLLPYSADNSEVRQIARALNDAAQFALFQTGNANLVLIPKDTGGTPQGAARAAREALDEGAEMLIGPLFSNEVPAVAPLARAARVPVLAFSSDTRAQEESVYLLSFQAEQDVRRVVEHAMMQGATRFAALVPATAYGSHVADAFRRAVYEWGGDIMHLARYDETTEGQQRAAREVAEYDSRRAALRAERATLRAAGDDASRRALARLDGRETYGDVSYDAVLIAEGGTRLRGLAPLLPYFDVTPRKVRFLGTGLWDDPALWREPALEGGWFAGPDPAMRDAFTSRFRSVFGYNPHRLSTLAYDAVTLAGALSQGEPGRRFTHDRLTASVGFYGVDGIFRFTPDGRTERGLAVLEVRDGSVRVVSPAPERFDDFRLPPAEGRRMMTPTIGSGVRRY